MVRTGLQFPVAITTTHGNCFQPGGSFPTGKVFRNKEGVPQQEWNSLTERECLYREGVSQLGGIS